MSHDDGKIISDLEKSDVVLVELAEQVKTNINLFSK